MGREPELSTETERSSLRRPASTVGTTWFVSWLSHSAAVSPCGVWAQKPTPEGLLGLGGATGRRQGGCPRLRSVMMATRGTEWQRRTVTWPSLLTALTATGRTRALSWLCTGPDSRPSTGAAGELPPALCFSLTSPLLWGPSLAPSPGSVCLGSRAALPEAGLAEKEMDSPPSGWRGSGPPALASDRL